MKRSLLAACCGFVLLFEGCKEVGPAIDFTPPDYVDSVYSLTAAQTAALTTDQHNVLIEEFTGQDCNNCPSAHETIENLGTTYPGRINAMGLYLYGIPQAVPPSGALYDFRDSIATTIGNTIYGGIGALPSGGIDRKGTPIFTDRTLWPDNVKTQLNIVDSVNISLKSSFDAATMTAKIVATVTYTQPVSTKQNLTIALTEDGMVDLQEFPDGVHSGYKFTNVFRDMISSGPAGVSILDTAATKARGRVLQRIYNYKVKSQSPAITPANCHVVAFINGTGTDQSIWQSVQTKLVP